MCIVCAKQKQRKKRHIYAILNWFEIKIWFVLKTTKCLTSTTVDDIE